ncbi:MAG: hypothetical protein E6H10_00290 [Bacteroidetes bacterium]|nr:MAG: hypothetical protein E6H10_00290 [Bacteroidota bacterium]
MNSQLAAFHGRRITVMPKDARLVARIISLWDTKSFLSAFITGTGPINEQQLPSRKNRRPKPRQPRPDRPAPHYRAKAPSKRPNTASNMTGGKGPQVRDELMAKAARR